MSKLSSYQKLKIKNEELKAEIAEMERTIARGGAIEKATLEARCVLACDMSDALWYGNAKDSEQRTVGIADVMKNNEGIKFENPNSQP